MKANQSVKQQVKLNTATVNTSSEEPLQKARMFTRQINPSENIFSNKVIRSKTQ